MIKEMLFAFGCLSLLAQPLKEPSVVRQIKESRKGVDFVIEEVLLPPKDEGHDYYPVLRVKRGGALAVEVTPEMLSAVMLEEDILIPCEKLRGEEKRYCFGKGIRGTIQYFALTGNGFEVEVYVELDTGSNREFLTFSVDLDAPHRVLRGETINGSGISIGVPSPDDVAKNPNYEEWFFYACTVTSRSPDPVQLAIVRPSFTPKDGGSVIYLGASDVGAPVEATRIDFENLKWEGFKELSFDVIFFGVGTSGEAEKGRKHLTYDVVNRTFIQPELKVLKKQSVKGNPKPTKAKGQTLIPGLR